MVALTTLTPLDDKIVIWGMSCSGKTTLAELIADVYGHTYYCFDALFPWHTIETLNLSMTEALRYVAKECKAERFVLDGWHLADREGQLLPPGSRIYVVYATYARIIEQYRVPVDTSHLSMFKKWYSLDYPSLRARYVENVGRFIEVGWEDLVATLALHQ